MTSIRNNLRILLILSSLMIAVLTSALLSPAQANEQLKLCAEEGSLSLANYFLESFGFKTDKLEKMPMDVRCFVANAAICEHFSGEEPYDIERKNEIIHGLTKYCTAAQSQMKFLKEKYKNLPDIQQILAVCENKGFSSYAPICASFDPSDIIQ